MSRYILGLHGFSAHNRRLLHDTGVCLVQNGAVISAINEERLSRTKNDGLFPWYAYKKICSDISSNEIEAIAFPDKKPLWQLYNILKYLAKTYRETGMLLNRYLLASLARTLNLKRKVPRELRGIPSYFIEHHLCHAASGYYCAPWDDVAIVTLDGMGDWCIGGTINIGTERQIETLTKTNGFYSPGFFYMYITSLLGFIPGRHEGKIMGLAAHGDPRKCYSVMKELISYRTDGHDFYSEIIPYELKHANYKNGAIDSEFARLKEILKNYSPEDIAAAAQQRVEEVVLDYIKDAIRLTNKNRLVLAGGVFANVKINERILKLPEVENIYVHPNMGDGGLSVGAALYCDHKLHRTAKRFMQTVYLGPSFCDTEVEKALTTSGISHHYSSNMAQKTAEFIHQGKIVGVMQGRMEYGPRALGNRSILAAATDAEINQRLNKRLSRTEFMPFAPAILEEFAKDYYPGWSHEHITARFMTITYKIAEKYKTQVPAIVHLDDTSRPQVVRKEDNAMFYDIISCYYKLSKIPLIINTSFNLHEEPIICSPDDAIRAFRQGAVDVLVMNNFYALLEQNG